MSSGVREERHEVARVEDALDVVEALAVDGHARVPLLREHPDDLGHGRVHLHRDHVGARHHHVARDLVAELEHAVDELARRPPRRAPSARAYSASARSISSSGGGGRREARPPGPVTARASARGGTAARARARPSRRARRRARARRGEREGKGAPRPRRRRPARPKRRARAMSETAMVGGGREVGDVAVRIDRRAGAVGCLVDRHQPAGLGALAGRCGDHDLGDAAGGGRHDGRSHAMASRLTIRAARRSTGRRTPWRRSADDYVSAGACPGSTRRPPGARRCRPAGHHLGLDLGGVGRAGAEHHLDLERASWATARSR